MRPTTYRSIRSISEAIAPHCDRFESQEEELYVSRVKVQRRKAWSAWRKRNKTWDSWPGGDFRGLTCWVHGPAGDFDQDVGIPGANQRAVDDVRPQCGLALQLRQWEMA